MVQATWTTGERVPRDRRLLQSVTHSSLTPGVSVTGSRPLYMSVAPDGCCHRCPCRSPLPPSLPRPFSPLPNSQSHPSLLAALRTCERPLIGPCPPPPAPSRFPPPRADSDAALPSLSAALPSSQRHRLPSQRHRLPSLPSCPPARPRVVNAPGRPAASATPAVCPITPPPPASSHRSCLNPPPARSFPRNLNVGQARPPALEHS